MIKVFKTKAEGKYLYINLHGFKNEQEWDLMYKKINALVHQKGEVKTIE